MADGTIWLTACNGTGIFGSGMWRRHGILCSQRTSKLIRVSIQFWETKVWTLSFFYWAYNEIGGNLGKSKWKLVIRRFLFRLYKSFIFYQNVNWWGKNNPNSDQLLLPPLWKQLWDYDFRKMTQLFWLLVSSSLKWSSLLIISGFEMFSYRTCFSN